MTAPAHHATASRVAARRTKPARAKVPPYPGATQKPIAVSTTPPKGKVSIFVPQRSLAPGYPIKSPTGLFFTFAKAPDALAFAASPGGVVVDGTGKPAAQQPWVYASSYQLQVTDHALVGKRPAGISVWFPPNYAATLLPTDPSRFAREGAWLPFASDAEAQQAVQKRGYGVVLDKHGELSPTQSWPQAGVFGARRLNSQMVAKRPHSYAVWIPAAWVGNAGVTDVTPFQKGGAFIAFKTEAEAAAHAKQRNMGVVLDPKGKPVATQSWYAAGQFAAQLRNVDLTAKRTAGKFGVWIPQNMLPQAGVTAGTSFPNGAYLSFDTEAEAQAHVKQRNLGVVFDKKGQLTPMQTWGQAVASAALSADLKGPPPSGWVTAGKAAAAAKAQQLGVLTAGSIAFESVKPTKKGADVEVFVGSARGNDTVHFSVGAQINGSWMPIYRIPDLMPLKTTGWTGFTLHLDFNAIETYLKSVNPGLGLTPGMQLAVGLEFATGHNTGMPGWTGSGSEKNAFFNLPAKGH